MNYLLIGVLLTTLLVGLLASWVIKLKREIKRGAQKESELLESEEKFRRLFDTLPVMLASFDKNCKSILWNSECERVFGWSKEEINSSSDIMAMFCPDVTLGDDVLRERYHTTKDGKRVVTRWEIITLLSNGEVITIGYDLTNQKDTEIELHKKTEQLNKSFEEKIKHEVEKNRQHQKMMIQQSRHAQMGEILSMIAHQWRQPLNNLSLIIQNAVYKYSVEKLDDDEVAKLDVESSTQIKQMSSTIKEFRNFFLPDNTSVIYDINKSVVDAVSIIKPILDAENIALTLNLQANIYVVGFPTELGQAIVNILTNSKDALSEKNIPNKSIKLSLALMNNEVKITIEDNGGGVPHNILEKIFDPYFSTKIGKNGTGLGLYMTKIIVEDHIHGKLDVSNSDNGFIVEIVIPQDV